LEGWCIIETQLTDRNFNYYYIYNLCNCFVEILTAQPFDSKTAPYDGKGGPETHCCKSLSPKYDDTEVHSVYQNVLFLSEIRLFCISPHFNIFAQVRWSNTTLH